MSTKGLTRDEKFFYANAGVSKTPDETWVRARRRCAKEYAYAEQRARDANCYFEWSQCRDVTSADWCDPNEPGGKNRRPWFTWECVARDGNGKVFASLMGIDFGRNGEPWGDPYKRVIEAELAEELPLGEDEQ